jgi:hypothetical protein
MLACVLALGACRVGPDVARDSSAASADQGARHAAVVPRADAVESTDCRVTTRHTFSDASGTNQRFSMATVRCPSIEAPRRRQPEPLRAAAGPARPDPAEGLEGAL